MRSIPQPKYDNAIFYKNRYIIAFYDSDDETHIRSFDNVWEICKYKKLELNNKNIQNLREQLCYALQRPDHSTEMLNGKLNHVYLIDMMEEIENL